MWSADRLHAMRLGRVLLSTPRHGQGMERDGLPKRARRRVSAAPPVARAAFACDTFAQDCEDAALVSN